MNRYISDLHIGCINKFDNRTLEVDQIIINHWNSVVHNNDTTYILGDIGKLGNNKDNAYVCSIISQLRGKKILIIGNHDEKELKDNRIKQLFTEIYDYKEIIDNFNGKNYKLVLSHYPQIFWNGQHKGWIHLYGHLHNSSEEQVYQKCLQYVNDYFADRELKGYTDCPQAKAYNVGAMLQNYTPLALKEIMRE
jgi:calcineurin-like phosphoesterase family protein